MDPISQYQQFYQNPTIQKLGKERRWTISGKLPKSPDGRERGKVPLNIHNIIAIMEGRPAQVCGARTRDEQSLTDLETITTKVPDATNCTFYLDCEMDEVMVLDIEKTCPPELRDKLLTLLPRALYAEYSMSGKGYHLILPLPENFYDYPNASGRTVVRHPKGYYEFLLSHYVTFTRHVLVDHPSTEDAVHIEPTCLEEVYEELAVQQKDIATVAFNVEEERPDIPHLDELVERLVNPKPHSRFARTLKDYDHDHSSYEFGYIGHLYFRLRQILKASVYKKAHTYSESDCIWIVYLAIDQILDHREKHDEVRNEIPMLMDRVRYVVSPDFQKKKEL